MHVLDKNTFLIEQRKDCLVEQFGESHGRTGQGRYDAVNAPLRNAEAGRKDVRRIKDVVGDNEHVASKEGLPKIIIKKSVLFETDEAARGVLPLQDFPGHRTACGAELYNQLRGFEVHGFQETVYARDGIRPYGPDLFSVPHVLFQEVEVCAMRHVMSLPVPIGIRNDRSFGGICGICSI